MKAFHILLFTICVALLGPPAVAADRDYLTYDKFIAELESGFIKSATLDRFSQIRGTHTVDGAERPFHSYGEVGSANDPLLNRLLKEKNVAVTLKDQKDRPSVLGGPEMIFSTVLMFVVPIVTLVLAVRINSKLNRLNKRPQGAL